MLGDFPPGGSGTFTVAVELKSPGTDLDRPQKTTIGTRSPVEQAFEYGRGLDDCRWVVVTDMMIVRLYSHDDDGVYVSFDLADACRPGITTDREFRTLYETLGHHALVAGGEKSAIAELLERSHQERERLTTGFYRTYFDIRVDLYDAIDAACAAAGIATARDDLLEATQRLLDRMLFMFYCEDHPSHLIPNDTVRTTVQTAQRMPGVAQSRVYELLKQVFREMDSGSPPASGLKLFGYNGELFKFHPILDVIDLPDALAKKRYSVELTGQRTRAVYGPWGLDVFDYWREFDERVLGLVIEESLSDLVALRTNQPVELAAKMAERKRHGIFYTSAVLSDFLADAAVRGLVDDHARREAEVRGQDEDDPELRLQDLSELKIADITCGSGAFLVAAYKAMLGEYWRQVSIKVGDAIPDLFTDLHQVTQASLLAGGLYGVDLLPQAVEIASLHCGCVPHVKARRCRTYRRMSSLPTRCASMRS